MDALLLQNISKSFDHFKAVDDLTVTVPAGSVYGFLGPNGAGKTTTIRMIMNIIRPDSGSVSIFGDSSVKNMRSRISYMPEERGLYRKMTVRSVLAYFGSLKNLSSNELNQRIPYWLEQVNLADYAKKKVEELSRGMHQKLQFAVAAINEPELLILDEPFSGLDPVNQEILKDIILKMRENGATILFSTHVMHEAEKLCDYILLINKGKTVIDGKLRQIKDQYRTGAVSAELACDVGFIEALPIVSSVKQQDNRFDIMLKDNADPQKLLAELVGKVEVTAFEVKAPSLHEIFIKLVGQQDE
jgi:ABC-2 type transport system ATP-binding protein